VPPAVHTVAQGGDQVRNLPAFGDVARKQDEAPGPLVAEEGRFIRRKLLPGHAEDHGF